MCKRALAISVVALMLAGCLPIELGVSSDGRVLIARQEGFFVLDPGTGKVTRVYAPADRQAVFGQFAPDGKQVLAISQATGKNQGDDCSLDLVTLADGSARPLLGDRVRNVTYARFSADGRHISFTRVADEQNANIKENLPELHLIDVATAKEQTVAAAGSVAGIHRWFPDSKSLLVFQIKDKVKADNASLYKGVIARWDIAGGKATELAAALGGNDVFFDLAPDGKTVLFTAAAAGKVGADLKAGDADTLFELKVETGAIREVRAGVRYALWSKTGAAVLVGVKGKDEKLDLEVFDAALSKSQVAATDVVAQAGSGMGGNTNIYPSWIGDGQVAYLAMRAVYGTAGRNLQLFIVSADGKTRKSLQTTIDAAAEH